MNGRLLKFLNPRLGAFSSFISMIIGVGLIFVSMGIFPGYNILNNWVSDLGANDGERNLVDKITRVHEYRKSFLEPFHIARVFFPDAPRSPCPTVDVAKGF